MLYSEFELDQATEIHKLLVFHSPRDPNKKVDWLEEMDAVAFATEDWNPYEETYKDLSNDSSEKIENNRDFHSNEQVSSRPVFGPEPPPYFMPEGYYSRNKDEDDDLEYEEALLREFEKEEQERENRKST